MISKSEIAKALRDAERLGEPHDEPEGSRFIIISDTLATKMADALEDSK